MAAPHELRLRGGTKQSTTSRERLAEHLYALLHPFIAALGVLFVAVVLAQRAADEGTALHRALLVVTWLLWAAFAAEYALRLVIAPSTGAFLRRTWWQLAFLVLPFLTMIRALFVLRMARPTRVALAVLRGTRSARATLTSRGAWLAVVTATVVFAGADVLYTTGGIEPYGAALHAAALAAMTGEATGARTGVGLVLDVVLALYAVVFFAALAGTLGAYFIEHRREIQTAPAAE